MNEQRVVNEEREFHPDPHVRRTRLVLWALQCGWKREQAAKLAGIGLATVERYVAAYRDGGLHGLRQWNVHGPVSDLGAYREWIQESFERQPARTIAEACARIEPLTGLQCRRVGCAHQPSSVTELVGTAHPTKLRVRHVFVLPVVVHADLRAGGQRFHVLGA